MPYLTYPERISREEGRAEGHAEGQREGLLAALDLGLTLRFGSEGTALLDEIRPITDVTLLQRLVAALKAGASPAEVRALVAERPAP